VTESSALGRWLYALLPEVYRSRDNAVRGADGRVQVEGDLARYLAAHGSLLDALKATLDQRLADAFPDNAPPGELSCQEWLLPYFADLLDVRLLSPDVAGRRNELANAVAWRQRKGTLAVVEAVSEGVGRIEAEVQEGWRRVARTARVGMPLLPASAYSESADSPSGDSASSDSASSDSDVGTASSASSSPSRAARHPGLPAVTPDVRRASRAVRTDPRSPEAKQTRYANEAAYWYLANRQGAPCFLDSYEDGSQRTVDFRHADWMRGHYHPRRVLIHFPPPAGFFESDPARVVWDERAEPASLDRIEIRDREEELEHGTLRVTEYLGVGERPVQIDGTVSLTVADGASDHIHRFENLCIDGELRVDGARLELRDCAVRRLVLEACTRDRAQLDARDSLFGSVVASDHVRLEYCTVLEALATATLQASDCIFMGSLVAVVGSPPASDASCIRFSRLPEQGGGFSGSAYALSCTSEVPIFYSAVYGERGCAVLHPSAPEAVTSGAEDGGEMGAFHARHYCLRRAAMQKKLEAYLPVGQTAVLIPDLRLLTVPPRKLGA